jgi:hypothetical protein
LGFLVAVEPDADLSIGPLLAVFNSDGQSKRLQLEAASKPPSLASRVGAR